MPTHHRIIVILQIILGLLFLTLPIYFMFMSGIDCSKEFENMSCWQRIQSIDWSHNLFNGDFGFHIKFSLLAILFVTLTLIKRIPFWLIVALRIAAGGLLLLFIPYYMVYYSGGSPSCNTLLDYIVVKYIHLAILLLHCYLFFAAFIPKANNKSPS